MRFDDEELIALYEAVEHAISERDYVLTERDDVTENFTGYELDEMRDELESWCQLRDRIAQYIPEYVQDRNGEV